MLSGKDERHRERCVAFVAAAAATLHERGHSCGTQLLQGTKATVPLAGGASLGAYVESRHTLQALSTEMAPAFPELKNTKMTHPYYDGARRKLEREYAAGARVSVCVCGEGPEPWGRPSSPIPHAANIVPIECVAWSLR